MPTILAKLNQKLSTIQESNSNPYWKDPHDVDYDRQKAEDALFYTIGPLLDNPTWADTKWASPGGPVQEFKPGGPAPQWTAEEITYAFAGDPSLLFQASGNPHSPGYGNKGGSPLFRLAKKVAKFAGKRDDKGFIEDLYGNGMIALVQHMKPGYDEGRSPFISYIIRTVQSAMEHGPSTTSSSLMAGGESGNYFAGPQGQFSKRAPEDREGWEERNVIGIAGILKMKDPQPEELRNAADAVKGKYQTERHHDKHPDNPLGPFSPKYYSLVNSYADAIESEDPDATERIQNQLRQFAEEIDQSNIQIRGASTGLGQAISTKDRAKGDLLGIRNQLRDMEIGDTAEINGIEVIKVDPTTIRIAGNDLHTEQAAQHLSNRGSAIQSIDVQDEKGGTAAGGMTMNDKLRHRGPGYDKDYKTLSPGLGGNTSIDPSSVKYLFDLAINTDLRPVIAKSPKYTQMAIDLNAKTNANTGQPVIGGPMGANEFRYLIRILGQMGSHYPGKDRPREKTDIMRDVRGWLQPGEDPEIEPIPESGGLWHSKWKRDGYEPMGPQGIADEMGTETLELQKVGIKTARLQKMLDTGKVMTKTSVALQTKPGWIKIKILGEIYKEQIKSQGLEESILKDHPIMESMIGMDNVDLNLMVTTCEEVVRLIGIQLFESSPKLVIPLPEFSLKLRKSQMLPISGIE